MWTVNCRGWRGANCDEEEAGVERANAHYAKLELDCQRVEILVFGGLVGGWEGGGDYGGGCGLEGVVEHPE